MFYHIRKSRDGRRTWALHNGSGCVQVSEWRLEDDAIKVRQTVEVHGSKGWAAARSRAVAEQDKLRAAYEAGQEV
jgi:hypothetical protein